MKGLVQILTRLLGIFLIFFSIFWVSENGEEFLKTNNLFLDNMTTRVLLGIDDRVEQEITDNKNIAEDNSPIFGLLDMTAFIFMFFLTLGMVLASVEARDLSLILHQIIFKLPSKILRDEERIEKSLRRVSENYYVKGGAGLSQLVEVKNLPVWPLILKQIEIKMPFHDIQMMMGNNAAFVRKEFDRHIKILNTISNFLPSLGVVGTVLGLIKLLFNMSDFSSIGPAMALALMTTFYGLLFSVIIFKPICMRLESLKVAIMRLYQTAGFWLVILDQRKPGIYLEQDFANKVKKEKNSKLANDVTK